MNICFLKLYVLYLKLIKEALELLLLRIFLVQRNQFRESVCGQSLLTLVSRMKIPIALCPQCAVLLVGPSPAM